MNRVVRENYPVDGLPADLRADLPAGVRVHVEITFEGASATPLPGQFSRHRALRSGGFASAEALDAHLAALRNEWDRQT